MLALCPAVYPGGGNAMTADWQAVRREYGHGTGIGALSRKYGIPESTLRGRARRENWKKIEPTESNAQKTYVEKDEQREERLRRVDGLADSMLTCLERAVTELDAVERSVKEKVKREDGADVTIDYAQIIAGEKSIIDRGGLRQLTGVLKDLKDILGFRSDLDSREQEARIARLQRELAQDEETRTLRVTLEGGCEEFAD